MTLQYLQHSLFHKSKLLGTSAGQQDGDFGDAQWSPMGLHWALPSCVGSGRDTAKTAMAREWALDRFPYIGTWQAH